MSNEKRPENTNEHEPQLTITDDTRLGLGTRLVLLRLITVHAAAVVYWSFNLHRNRSAGQWDSANETKSNKDLEAPHQRVSNGKLTLQCRQIITLW